MAVSRILGHKGGSVITAAAEDTVHDLSQKLAKYRIGAVVVLGGAGQIAGIVSERDIVRALAQHGTAALAHPISSVMSTTVKTCKPSDGEAELMALMTEHRIRHLPVVEGGQLVGMISIGDVVKFHIEAIEREAADMKAYIASAG
jgi:CBS domain-containing protein